MVGTSQAWNLLSEAVRLASHGARLAIVGTYRSDPQSETARELLQLTAMNSDLFCNQGLKIVGCSNDPVDDFPPGVVRWTLPATRRTWRIEAGTFDPRPLITHRFRCDELAAVYERFVTSNLCMVGVILKWDCAQRAGRPRTVVVARKEQRCASKP